MVVQPRLDMPPEILEGLASGVYKLFGGTVRHATEGYIVKHLQNAPDEVVDQLALATKGASVRFPSALKNPWVIGATVLSVAVVAVAATAAIRTKRAKPEDQPELSEIPEQIISFEGSLRAYMEAARTGTLNESVITRLIDALDKVQTDESIDFADDQAKRLVALIVKHTGNLAAANSIDLDDLLEPVAEGQLADHLRRHLVAQRSIFSSIE